MSFQHIYALDQNGPFGEDRETNYTGNRGANRHFVLTEQPLVDGVPRVLMKRSDDLGANKRA